jgi:hypothetical protein
LQALTENLHTILRTNLVGVYLYGSIIHRAFNPKSSDVDCIVVTKRELSEKQFVRLRKWLTESAKLNSWTTRLQITFLIKDQVVTINARACLYQFGILKRCCSDGNPIIWLNVLKSGAVLFGPSAESFVPPITSEILFQALEREVGYLQAEISNKPKSEWRDVSSYRDYAVLTLCRILYSGRKGKIVSKQTAANWAIKHLPPRWHQLIRQALQNKSLNRTKRIPLHQIRQFIDFADTQLHLHRGSTT